MASERRRDDAKGDLPDLSQPPFPLPPGWVYHPASPNASLEELRKHVGVFRATREIKVASMFDEDEDRDCQTFWFDDADQDHDAGS